MMVLIKWQIDGLVFERPAEIPTNNAHSGNTMLNQAIRVIHDYIGYENETPAIHTLRVKGMGSWSDGPYYKMEPLTSLPKRNYIKKPKSP